MRSGNKGAKNVPSVPLGAPIQPSQQMPCSPRQVSLKCARVNPQGISKLLALAAGRALHSCGNARPRCGCEAAQRRSAQECHDHQRRHQEPDGSDGVRKNSLPLGDGGKHRRQTGSPAFSSPSPLPIAPDTVATTAFRSLETKVAGVDAQDAAHTRLPKGHNAGQTPATFWE